MSSSERTDNSLCFSKRLDTNQSMSARKGSQRTNVRVVVRIRPTNQKEIQSGGVQCVKDGETNIEVFVDDGSHAFNFDHVFGMESTQVQIFEYTAVPLVQDVLSGYNATIFAYGQTGTGKVSLVLRSICYHC